MSYKHISFAQRCKISAFWKVGYLQKDIAKELDINPSTVSRELKRNSRWNGVYCPEQAASFYKTRIGTIDKGFHFLGINYLETQPLDGTNVTQVSLDLATSKQTEQFLNSMGGGGGRTVQLQLIIRNLCMKISFRTRERYEMRANKLSK